jgi:hypothetical protein
MSKKPKLKEVVATQAILFDADFKTFRLYAGGSMYAFCITPELGLEHLYWGVALPPGFDLRYLSQSARNAHFNTVEEPPDRFGGRIVVGAETLDELMKSYKESKVVTADSSRALYNRRLENYTWRIMNKAVQSKKEGKLPELLIDNDYWLDRGRSLSDLHDKAEHEEEAAWGSRRRSQTTVSPPQKPRRPSFDGKLAPSFSSASVSFDLNSPPRTNPTQQYVGTNPVQQYLGMTRRKSRQALHQHRQTFERTTGKMGKGLLCCEYSDHGTGDFRTPSFMVVDNSNGSSISPLRYKRHAIYRGKLPMPDSMPAIRCHNEREASTLVVTMTDVITGLEVDLVYGKCCYCKVRQFQLVPIDNLSLGANCSGDAQLRRRHAPHRVPQRGHPPARVHAQQPLRRGGQRRQQQGRAEGLLDDHRF